MKVKHLIEILKGLEQEALIDLALDEEGNAFGDISDILGEEVLLNGEMAYVLYPENQELPEDRCEFE